MLVLNVSSLLIKILISKKNSKCKQEEKSLKNILEQHLKPINNNSKIKIQSYFKANKISSQFSTRPKNADPCHVVYQFNCTEPGCKSSYIGYTTNTLKTRAYQHKFKPSKIQDHYEKDHLQGKVENIEDKFKILFKSNSLCELRIAEAILIRSMLPDINVKHNELNKLHLF